MKNKKKLFFLILLLIVIGCGKKNNKENENPKIEKVEYKDSIIKINTSLEDELSDNNIWCGTFNLVWNILKDEYVGGDVIVNKPSIQVDNLNKSTFTKNNLNENSFYVNYGKQTPELKNEIEKNIKTKFNQTSDILNKFEWKENSDDDFMYAMLYKNFKFKNKFNKSKNTTFNNEGDYEYFGINTENESRSQVRVLYYNNEKENAIKLLTDSNDEVILAKGVEGKSLFEIYNNLNEKEKNYEGNKLLLSYDSILVPIIKFNIFEEFESLKNLEFKYKNGENRKIAKAVQTIKLSLTEEGGEIRSEAGISTKKNSVAITEQNNVRTFNYNSTFVLFLKEKDSELPYFAAYITNLKEFQK